MVDSERKILKTAVIGLGKMGLVHSSLLCVMPEVKLTALCDKSRMTRRIFRKLFKKVRMTENLEDLRSMGLDLVYVTTPIPSHFPIVKAIYEMGIAPNVFVEKTLSHNCGEAEELCRLAQKSSGANMVGYMKRFSVTFKKARDLLSENTLGHLTSFEGYAYSSDFSEVDEGSGVSVSRGGVLGDLGSHVLDLALWLLGDLVVKNAELKGVGGGEGEDYALIHVKGSDDLEGRFDITWCKREYRMPEFGLYIRGTNGALAVDDDRVELVLDNKRSSKWYRHDLNDYVGFLLGGPEYYREDDCFVKASLSGNAAEPSFLVASRVDRLIEEIKRKGERR